MCALPHSIADAPFARVDSSESEGGMTTEQMIQREHAKMEKKVKREFAMAATKIKA